MFIEFREQLGYPFRVLSGLPARVPFHNYERIEHKLEGNLISVFGSGSRIGSKRRQMNVSGLRHVKDVRIVGVIDTATIRMSWSSVGSLAKFIGVSVSGSGHTFSEGPMPLGCRSQKQKLLF